MVGGVIKFNASSSQGTISSYAWDFYGNGNFNTSGVVAEQIYTNPQKYVVTLKVTDTTGNIKYLSREIDLTLKPGDILVERPLNPTVPGDSWTHAAIIVDPTHVIEALEGGVTYNSIDKFFYPNKTWVAVYRVTNDQNVINKALEFVWKQLNKPYDLGAIISQGVGWSNKRLNSDSWYCSELIWASYMQASDGSIDLDTDRWGNAVHPEELVTNGKVTLVGEHKEFRPPSGNLQNFVAVIAQCPVDLILKNPNGLFLSEVLNQIPNSDYQEEDIDLDRMVEDMFYISGYDEGIYRISVIGESNSTQGTFSLFAACFDTNGEINMLNIIQNAPITPYAQTFSIYASDELLSPVNDDVDHPPAVQDPRYNHYRYENINGQFLKSEDRLPLQDTGTPLVPSGLAALLMVSGLILARMGR
jgi:uncharacterized protein YycO